MFLFCCCSTKREQSATQRVPRNRPTHGTFAASAHSVTEYSNVGAFMRDFDSEIDAHRKRLAVELENLNSLQGGRNRQFRDGADITTEMITKTQRTILQIETELATCESRAAHSTRA